MLAVFGRLILRPLFQLVAAARSEELFVAACLLVVIGTGLIGAALGLPMALGAFIAGLLLAETEYNRQVEVTIRPFQGLLLGLFFVSVGAGLDLSYVVTHPALTIGVAAAFVALKTVLLLPLARVMGLSWKVARETALVLGPGGEFALVAVGAAVATDVVPAGAAAVTMIAATLSMFTIPWLVRVAERISPADSPNLPELDELMPQPDAGAAGVIVVGYGRVGKLIGEMLASHQIPYLAIDQDVALVTRERRDGKSIYYGDATRVEFLRRCGIGTARALVVTLDVPAANEAIVAAARTERPDLTIVARARDAAHATRLYDLNVTDAVPETIEASLQLSEALLVDIGVPMGLVIASIHEKRDEFRRMLQSPNAEARQRRGIRASTRRAPGEKK
jgi:CPA2 family monovalent cation:H+ antiporter-2